MSASGLLAILVERLHGAARALVDVLRTEHRVLGLELPFLVWVALAGVAGGALAYWLSAPRPRRERARVREAALGLLPPHVRRTVEASPAGPPETTGFLASPAGAAAPGPPPYLFVVQRWRNPAFEVLRELAWTHPDLIETIWDRRWIGDRRLGRQAVATDRRGAERRLTASAAGPTWEDLGFVLVTHAGGHVRLEGSGSARPAPAP